MTQSITADQIAFLQSEEVRHFIRAFPAKDIHLLLLNPPELIRGNEKLVADQIKSHAKARHKLPLWYENEQVIYPPPLSLEQCSSTITAAYKRDLVQGDMLVDLTGGMGVDSLALSQNFNQSAYVDTSPLLTATFEHNQKVFGDNIQVVNQTAEAFISGYTASEETTFFIDPSRRDAAAKKVFQLEDCSPDIISLLPELLSKGKTVLIKAAPMLDIKAAMKSLPNIERIHILALRNEVKEILILIKKDYDQEPMISAVNMHDTTDRFDFKYSKEQDATANFGDLKKYLYDPNDAITKAGAFKLVGTKHGLQKMAPNTHFFSADKLIAGFPGRVFEVLAINPKKTILAQLKNTNVILKNHPSTTAEIRKKYKLKDGGDHFLIGFRDHDSKAILALCKKS